MVRVAPFFLNHGVVALEQHDAERSRSRRRCNDETPERSDSRRLAQCVTPATSVVFRNA